MSRQIVLDTETTGLDPQQGHRIIEIGCVEMLNRKLTGRHFHYYINPQREVDEGAFAVHGISTEFLADKPIFAKVCQEFLQFVDGAADFAFVLLEDLAYILFSLAVVRFLGFQGLVLVKEFPGSALEQLLLS